MPEPDRGSPQFAFHTYDLAGIASRAGVTDLFMWRIWETHITLLSYIFLKAVIHFQPCDYRINKDAGCSREVNFFALWHLQSCSCGIAGINQTRKKLQWVFWILLAVECLTAASQHVQNLSVGGVLAFIFTTTCLHHQKNWHKSMKNG